MFLHIGSIERHKTNGDLIWFNLSIDLVASLSWFGLLLVHMGGRHWLFVKGIHSQLEKELPDAAISYA